MIQKELAALFRRLGARDPEGWARSQLQEEIPQLARFLFLRQAWRTIIGEEDATWIDENIARAEREPNEPFAGVGLALKKLRARGAADDEIIDLVRGMQAELLFSLCYLLEDPGDLEPEIAGVSWILAQIDEEGNVIGSISSLHESVLETDPTGREMRPRRSAGQR